VYRGLFSGQLVAIKKLRSLGGDELALPVSPYHATCMADLNEFGLQKFFREALVWHELHHTNVLPFLGIDKDLFPDRPLPSLITPWMERGTLSDYIKSSEYLASRDELSFVCVSCIVLVGTSADRLWV
jgi:serine/threonine protein kinase